MGSFSKNFNHHRKRREQKEHFQTILVIIFWNFTIFEYRSDSPQEKLKENFISSIANFEQLKTQDPWKLGKIKKISNLGQWLVFLQKLRLCEQKLKNTQKQIPNFSFLVQFFQITSFCSKYFIQDSSQFLIDLISNCK